MGRAIKTGCSLAVCLKYGDNTLSIFLRTIMSNTELEALNNVMPSPAMYSSRKALAV